MTQICYINFGNNENQRIEIFFESPVEIRMYHSDGEGFNIDYRANNIKEAFEIAKNYFNNKSGILAKLTVGEDPLFEFTEV